MIIMDSMGQILPLRRRKLNRADLVRMRLPKRYWNVNYDGVSDFSDGKEARSPRDTLRNYIRQMDDMKEDGMGVLLWGPNGTGKTSMAAIVAKEYRRRFCTVLFLEAAALKSLVKSKDLFDEDETYWQRAKEVDVLVLDDLCKGVQDTKGFGEQVLDELLRARNANQLVTIITTNASPKGKEESLSVYLKPSTISLLKEHVSPVHVRGVDKRDVLEQKAAHRMAD